MNYAAYHITLDIHKTGSQVALSMIRGENRRKIVISLVENGKPYKITEGCIANFAAVKPDGKYIYNSCNIDFKNNLIIYEITTYQTTAAIGEVKCQIELIGGDGGVLFSPTFSLVVSDKLYHQEPIVASSEEFNALTAYLANLQQKFSNREFEADLSPAIVCTSAGNVITISDSSESCFEAFNIYGESTQDGIPTPEKPVEIISAGACKSFNYDENLYDDTQQDRSTKLQEVFIPANMEFTVGVYSSGGKSQYNACFVFDDALDENTKVIETNASTGWVTKHFKFKYTVKAVKFYSIDSDTYRTIDKIMVCYGKQQINDTSYKPYPEDAITAEGLRSLYGSGGSITVTITDGTENNVQNLVIETPNELRAVGDCRDYIDFVKGVKVKNCEKIKYNGDNITTDFISSTGALTDGATVIYALSEPVEIPLTPEQIAQFKPLKTNYPLTVISNDENVFMKVGYRADTKNFIKKMAGSTTKISSVVLSASKWVGSASLYSQVVTIPGVTENSKIDLNPTVEQLSIFHNKDISFVIGNKNGVTTAYCIGQKPTNDYTMQVTITEVAINA